MTLSKGVKVDMTLKNSLRSVLGFESKVYNEGRHESENTVNIMSINSILVHCNLIGSSYLNGTLQPIIYSFFPNVSPGSKIVEKPSYNLLASLLRPHLPDDFVADGSN